MEDQSNETGSRKRRLRVWFRIMLGIVAAGLVAVMVASNLMIASGQTPGPTPPEGEASDEVRPGLKRRGHGPGFGGGIHGEFTTHAPGGGYQVIATQKGEVTSVSASSIAVKSEDGFSRTYSVDDNTLVNAGNDGIADVKTGDDVHVTAIVVDGKARAVAVRDGTRIYELREKWAPPRPNAQQDKAQSSANT